MTGPACGYLIPGTLMGSTREIAINPMIA
jgi:hypothetical protein